MLTHYTIYGNISLFKEEVSTSHQSGYALLG